MHEIGEIIKVKVSEVKPYAAFVCDENDEKGMIHISELSDTYIRDIEKIVEKGDEINVLVLSIDERDGFFRASYKKVPPEQQFNSHVNLRKALITDDSEFDSLREKLPEWIEDSLRRNGDKK